MKKIVLASDSFKGTLSSLEICQIAKEVAAKHSNIHLITIPIADGGEGTCEAFASCLDGEWKEVSTVDANRLPTKAKYFVFGKTAIIEVASVVGLAKTSLKDPRSTTTYGLGALIRDAIRNGITDIILGLGGSSTNDAGLGLAYSLGAKFFNENKKEIEAYSPSDMSAIHSIDLSSFHSLLANIRITAMCDVKNPLCGKEGASAVFGPQKGAKPTEIEYLDGELHRFSKIIAKSTGIDKSAIPGAGAAGGLGFFVSSIAGGTLRSGIDTVLDVVHFSDSILDADLVITGEGKVDSESFNGKVIDGILHRCKKHDVPCFILAGCLDQSISTAYLYSKGITKTYLTSSNRHNEKEIAEHAHEDYASSFALLLKDLQ